MPLRSDKVSLSKWTSPLQDRLPYIRFIGLMYGIQTLKFVQHPALQRQLLDTGVRPLAYAQVPVSSEDEDEDVTRQIMELLFPSDESASTSLQHIEDYFWGTTMIELHRDRSPSLLGNHLGLILEHLRARFRQEQDETVKLCTSLADILVPGM